MTVWYGRFDKKTIPNPEEPEPLITPPDHRFQYNLSEITGEKQLNEADRTRIAQQQYYTRAENFVEDIFKDFKSPFEELIQKWNGQTPTQPSNTMLGPDTEVQAIHKSPIGWSFPKRKETPKQEMSDADREEIAKQLFREGDVQVYDLPDIPKDLIASASKHSLLNAQDQAAKLKEFKTQAMQYQPSDIIAQKFLPVLRRWEGGKLGYYASNNNYGDISKIQNAYFADPDYFSRQAADILDVQNVLPEPAPKMVPASEGKKAVPLPYDKFSIGHIIMQWNKSTPQPYYDEQHRPSKNKDGSINYHPTDYISQSKDPTRIAIHNGGYQMDPSFMSQALSDVETVFKIPKNYMMNNSTFDPQTQDLMMTGYLLNNPLFMAIVTHEKNSPDYNHALRLLVGSKSFSGRDIEKYPGLSRKHLMMNKFESLERDGKAALIRAIEETAEELKKLDPTYNIDNI